MKRFLNITALLSLLFVSACDKAPETETPDSGNGTIEIFVDSQAINIDNSEVATFSVILNGNEDITDKAQIINITGGGYDVLKKSNFTTYRPGIHTFFATYGNLTSSQISISATSQSNLSSTFYRRTVVHKFTGTWCTHCPSMSKAIELAKYKYPDRLIEVAVHSGDQLAIDQGDEFKNFFDITGLPSVIIDMDASSLTGMANASLIVEKAKSSLESNPTTVGIKLETSIVGDKLNIDVEATFTADGKYKIAAMLLQSGFNYEQSGTSDASYRQNHVLRGFYQTDVLGDSIGERLAQERYQQHWEQPLPADITSEQLAASSIVVYVLNERGDALYTINNAAECTLGESSPYQFEPIITDEE